MSLKNIKNFNPFKYIIIPNRIRDIFISKKTGLYKYKDYEEYKQGKEQEWFHKYLKINVIGKW